MRASSLPVHLRGKLARRLFLRFMAVGAVPLFALAAYSYNVLSHVLRDGLDVQLRDEGKALGMELVGDLRQRAAFLASYISGRSPLDGTGFVRIEEVDETTLATSQPGVSSTLARIGAAILLDAPGDAKMWVRKGDGVTLQGRLNESSLWSRDIAQSAYCVLTRAYEVIFCSNGFEPVPEKGARIDDAGMQLRGADGSELRVARWQANLEGLFGSDGFVVVVGRPQYQLDAALAELRIAFIALLILATAISVFLAMAQLRRQLRPLENLSQAARRIADGNLEIRLAADGDDELSVLGNAFNRMLETLAAKFVLLKLLADLDHAILNGTSRREIAGRVLDDLLSACMVEDGGLLALSDKGEGYYFAARKGGAERQAMRTVSESEVRAWSERVREAPEWFSLDIAASMAGIPGRANRETLVFPLRVEGVTRAYLLLVRARGEGTGDPIRAGSSIADRMAVAGSSKARADAFYRQTHFSALTGLPNRVLLRDRVGQAISRSKGDGRAFALMLIDFDDFRFINEGLSRQAGDHFLSEAAARLGAIVGASDTVAHLAADQFAILASGLPEEGRELHLYDMVERIQCALSAPVLIDGKPVQAQARVGIALHPDNADSFDTLFECADVALRYTKEGDGTISRFFSADMNEAVSMRFALAQELRTAMRDDELLLYYQPKVDAISGRIVGAEALIRWQSPTRGLVSPAVFLPVVEGMGLNRWLTDFVLESACRRIRSWEAEGLEQVPVSVNIPPEDLSNADFEQRVDAAMKRHCIGPGRLEIEILESTETDTDVVKDTLERLRKRGVKVSLDDFGAGYSSLVYLTAMPADVLKLDRAFVRNLVDNPRQQSIVKQVIVLAHSLGFAVVAEGVEDVMQREILIAMHCDQIQGYLFAPPLPAEVFALRLQAQRAGAPVEAGF